MKKLSLFICLFFAFAEIVIAKTITGTVTNQGTPLVGVNVIIQNTNTGTTTDFDGNYSIEAEEGCVIEFNYLGYKTQRILLKKQNTLNVILEVDNSTLEEVVVIGYGTKRKSIKNSKSRVHTEMKLSPNYSMSSDALSGRIAGLHITNYHEVEENISNESYASIAENGFKNATQTPLSTFSIDVDAASYSNMRRFVMNGQRPPKDAVRVEEMINYFNYSYPQPTNEHPFSITTEVANCPWNSENKLVHIGLQGKSLETEEAPASNIVFLIDVSGSMSNANKLPLLKKAYTLLVNQLRKQDRIAIVVYAGSSGLVLPSTPGDKKETILNALNNLQSGGSTAGAAGLKLAYKVAEDNFIKGGNNRIILATDGDFNVGQSSDQDLEKLIVSNRDKGIFMSVTGFGMGNYKDSKMEIIADKGNGNYSYIDNLLEAKKIFINEFSSTLFTIAKDVKIQIEFNPTHVKSYRLIGYENRLLNNEDFKDDKKDAGELGAGHTVTALYEIVPTTNIQMGPTTLKYQTVNVASTTSLSNELATVKFRYKKPNEDTSKLIVKTIPTSAEAFNTTTANFKFSSAVAGFGMLLKDSEHKGNLTYTEVLKIAKTGKGIDEHGYRSEFIRLIGLAEHL